MAEMLAGCSERFGRLDERVKDCEDYQCKNNGAIVRLDSKFNKVIYLLLASLGAVITDLVIHICR